MNSAARLAAALALLVPAGGLAHPEGAPWDALDADGEACASCHFDRSPIEDSGALTLAGLPDTVEPGQSYRLTVRFAPEAMDIAGFLIVARAADGAPAGAFEAAGERVESRGAAARSTLAGSEPQDGAATWTVAWRAPETPGTAVISIAANAGNRDASPFGDRIHLRRAAAAVGQKKGGGR